MGDRIKTALDEFKDRTVLIVKDRVAAIKLLNKTKRFHTINP